MAFFKGGSKESHRSSVLKQQREKDRLELESKKKKLESPVTIDEICPKFKTRQHTALTSDTVGLVTLEELKAQQEAINIAREKQEIAEKSENTSLKVVSVESQVDEIEKGPMSFNYNSDDDDVDEIVIKRKKDETDDDSSVAKKKRYGVNPKVDFRFIPDIYRKEEEARLREELKKEWIEKQAAIKEEEVKFLYSYWDGSGHRKEISVRKGDTIQGFLNKCLEQLRREFPDLRAASADKLMYIKDDLIIPHHNTFYDFIVSRANGKSGPLFNFEERGNVKIVQGVIMEDDGKICLRSWYERNKHIFPASRWEPYDPVKNWDHCSALDKFSAKIIVK